MMKAGNRFVMSARIGGGFHGPATGKTHRPLRHRPAWDRSTPPLRNKLGWRRRRRRSGRIIRPSRL